MPIKPENRNRYPENWPEIRKQILARAGNRCERCRVHNYAVGWRDHGGDFHPTGGNEWHDRAAMGELPYREAAEGVRLLNESGEGVGPNGERGIVIVLTIAHLNHDLDDHRPEVLRAFCQRCHNRHDRAYRQANAVRTRETRKRRVQPVLLEL